MKPHEQSLINTRLHKYTHISQAAKTPSASYIQPFWHWLYSLSQSNLTLKRQNLSIIYIPLHEDRAVTYLGTNKYI